MLKVTDTKEIARRRKEHETIFIPAWYDGGHMFSLVWCYVGEFWEIHGGCRAWNNLDEALTHYGKDWRRSDGRTTEATRQRRRKIVKAIAAFAKKHKFTLYAPEPKKAKRR